MSFQVKNIWPPLEKFLARIELIKLKALQIGFPILILLPGIARSCFGIAKNSEELQGIVGNCKEITGLAIEHK